MDINEKIKKLKEFLHSRPEVSMAFIFGSYAKGRMTEDSDFDIAVYFKTEGELEIEKRDKEYSGESEIRGMSYSILGTDNVDFVVLNRAPANIAEEAIFGIPLVIKDDGLWLEFMLATTGRAEDFRSFVRDYDKIYWRSQSLTAKDAHSLFRRLEFLNSETDVIKKFSNLSWREYQSDDTKRRVVERAVENIMNAVIDISKIIFASQKKPAPQSYREAVENASLLLNVSEDEVKKLSSWTSLRNILAHEYLDLRWKDISGFLKDINVLEIFLRAAKNFADGS